LVRLIICGLNQKESPSPSTVRLTELASVNMCVCWRFLECLFFPQRSFFMSPFAFFGVASFSIEGLCDKPLCIFGVGSFFIRGLYDKHLFVFGIVSFFIKGLCDKPLCVFGVVSFFIRGLYDKPLFIFGVASFLLEVFVISPFTFLGLPFLSDVLLMRQ
jgi:hypothetical protein